MFMVLTSLLFAKGLVITGGTIVLDALCRRLCVSRYAKSANKYVVLVFVSAIICKLQNDWHGFKISLQISKKLFLFKQIIDYEFS